MDRSRFKLAVSRRRHGANGQRQERHEGREERCLTREDAEADVKRLCRQ